MYRLLSVGIVVVWLGAMVALFMRDVYPAWTAQDAPPMTMEQFVSANQREQQVGIYDAKGKRLGTAWSDLFTTGATTGIRGTVHVEGISLVPQVLIETSIEFDADGALDNFNLDVFGVPMTTIRIRGERHGIYFPCTIQVGPIHRQANLEMAASRLLGDSFRPFSYLPTLEVGQSWRMQVIDPVSAVLGGSTRFVPLVAQVTGKETIDVNGKPVECFVVRTHPGKATAWVGENGRVYVQEVDVPGMGTLTVREEAYDDAERDHARALMRKSYNSGQRQPGKLPRIPSMSDVKATMREAIERMGHGGND